jgi:hypothetical protein
MGLSSKKVRTRLLVGVSMFALTVAVPKIASAADLPVKAPPPVPALSAGVLTMYLEGGPMFTGGGSVNYYDPANIPLEGERSIKPNMGWTGAGGIDYQFAASPWHASFDFRYGAASKSQNSFVPGHGIGFIGESGFATGASHASHSESHWVADFMIGRDVGLGVPGSSQVKLGVRVADLSATTTVYGGVTGYVFGSPTGHSFAAASGWTQTSTFLGVGPRLAIDGSAMMQGPWSIDYEGGVAMLYGDRKLSVDNGLYFNCNVFSSGCNAGTFSSSSSSHGWVPNVDASAALAYAITPHFKVAGGYQFDYYWNALRTYNSSGNIVNIDRDYSGPFLRVTGKF